MEDNSVFDLLDKDPEEVKQELGDGSRSMTNSNNTNNKDDYYNDVIEPVDIDPTSVTISDNEYAAAGERDISSEISHMFTSIGMQLKNKGFINRCANNDRDAVESATISEIGDDDKDIYLPWNGFNNIRKPTNNKPIKQAYEISAKYHMVFNKLSPPIRAFVARSTSQILGHDCNNVINFFLCYTNDGAEAANEITSKTGPTGHMIRLCNKMNIPVFNLKKKESVDRFKSFIKSKESVSEE